MRVEAFVLDVPAPVSLGDFESEADALLVVHSAQSRGVITREGAGFTLVPASRVLRYVGAAVEAPALAPVVKVQPKPARRRAR